MEINSKITKACTALIVKQLAKERFDRKLLTFTKKQVRTLLLFSQNYSLPVIAGKEGVCLSAIRGRLQTLKKSHWVEYNKALTIRQVYKNDRDAIRDMTDFQSHKRKNNDDEERDFEEFVSVGYNGIKRKF